MTSSRSSRPSEVGDFDRTGAVRPVTGDRLRVVRGRRRGLEAADADGRPDRQDVGGRCSSRSSYDTEATTTTCSSRPAPWARTTGRRCPTRTGTRPGAGPRPPSAARINWRRRCTRSSPTTRPTNPGRPRTARRPARPASGTRRTGNSGGYQDWKVDLVAYAGKQVEVSITLRQDFASRASASSSTTPRCWPTDRRRATSFEDGLGGWSATGPPAGSEPNPNNWVRTEALLKESAAVETADSLYFGFGLEGVRGAGGRATGS